MKTSRNARHTKAGQASEPQDVLQPTNTDKDSDGEGLTDFEEALVGTDPTDRARDAEDRSREQTTPEQAKEAQDELGSTSDGTEPATLEGLKSRFSDELDNGVEPNPRTPLEEASDIGQGGAEAVAGALRRGDLSDGDIQDRLTPTTEAAVPDPGAVRGQFDPNNPYDAGEHLGGGVTPNLESGGDGVFNPVVSTTLIDRNTAPKLVETYQDGAQKVNGTDASIIDANNRAFKAGRPIIDDVTGDVSTALDLSHPDLMGGATDNYVSDGVLLAVSGAKEHYDDSNPVVSTTLVDRDTAPKLIETYKDGTQTSWVGRPTTT